MHAISSYRGNRPTNTQTDKDDYNTLRHSFASAQCKHTPPYDLHSGYDRIHRYSIYTDIGTGTCVCALSYVGYYNFTFRISDRSLRSYYGTSVS